MLATYPGKVNSPQTTISEAISAADTIIKVVDISALPAAPNIATLGVDSSAETILYTGISGNNLTGCTRGFQGAASTWGLNTKIARTFTAYDFDALRVNMEQVILELQGKNLLHNWDFRNPVNQRGLTSKNSCGYFIDRWVYFSAGSVYGTISLNAGNKYLSIASSTDITGINEFLENLLPDGVYTLSIKTHSGQIYSGQFTVSGTSVTGSLIPVGVYGSVNFGYSSGKHYAQITANANQEMQVDAIKLEKGSVSTLANDAPADYGEQLQICKRFYEILGKGMIAIAQSSSQITVCALFSVEKRVVPTISLITTSPVISDAPYTADFTGSNISDGGYLASKLGLSYYNMNNWTGLTTAKQYIFKTDDVLAIDANI